MSILTVKNLIFSGRHGTTGRERLDVQRFELEININLDTKQATQSDQLIDTYDYKDAIEIAKYVIENERYVLIETIANKIAERICLNPKIYSCEVSIKKLDALNNGYPEFTLTLKRSPQEIHQGLKVFDSRDLFETLEKEGGVSIPILTEEYRGKLLEEAESYSYIKQPEIVGPAKVKEQLSSNYQFRPGSLFGRLKEDFENLLKEEIQKNNINVFNPPLEFNELSLQLYEKGSIGITPHLDNFSSKNLICIFVLTGHAKFALCDDREGSNPRYLDTTPGNVIIMRAPGLFGSADRPFHFVSDITERRIVFGLRQDIKKPMNFKEEKSTH
jgi:dihydroneopterin aldolase